MNEARLISMMFLASAISNWPDNLKDIKGAVLMIIAIAWFCVSVRQSDNAKYGEKS